MTRSRIEQWADRWARHVSREKNPLFLFRTNVVSGLILMVIACLPSVSSLLLFFMGAWWLQMTWRQLERAGFIRMLEATNERAQGAEDRSSRAQSG